MRYDAIAIVALDHLTGSAPLEMTLQSFMFKARNQVFMFCIHHPFNAGHPWGGGNFGPTYFLWLKLIPGERLIR